MALKAAVGKASQGDRMKRSFEKTLRIALLLIGLVLASVVFYQVWVVYYNPYIRLPFYRRGNYMITLMYMAILTICVLVMKGQGIGRSRLAEVIISQCIALTMTAVVVYFPMSLLQYELLRPLPLLIMLPGQWLLVFIWNYLANFIYVKLVPPLKLLLVCDRGDGWRVADKLNKYPKGYSVNLSANVSEGKAVIWERLHACDGVLLDVHDDVWRSWVIRQCFKKDKLLFLVPTLTDVIVNCTKELHQIDTPLLCSREHRHTIEERAVKRAMDVVLSALALLLVSPLLLAIALAIKLDDGGPVLFRQERLTRDGKLFCILKFRSMVPDAERDGQRLAEEHDARVTRVGHMLRKTRLDELPQLFNVLWGDMSLVGPRPECPSIAARYEKQLPEFAYRLKVKAGITGYAQVYGDYATDPADKLMMDIMYIEQHDIVVDLNIMLLTIRALFMTDKTRGRKEQVEAKA